MLGMYTILLFCLSFFSPSPTPFPESRSADRRSKVVSVAGSERLRPAAPDITIEVAGVIVFTHGDSYQAVAAIGGLRPGCSMSCRMT